MLPQGAMQSAAHPMRHVDRTDTVPKAGQPLWYIGRDASYDVHVASMETEGSADSRCIYYRA